MSIQAQHQQMTPGLEKKLEARCVEVDDSDAGASLLETKAKVEVLGTVTMNGELVCD